MGDISLCYHPKHFQMNYVTHSLIYSSIRKSSRLR